MCNEAGEILAKIGNWELDGEIGKDAQPQEAAVYVRLRNYFQSFFYHFDNVSRISRQLSTIAQDFIRESAQIEQVAVFLKKGVSKQTADIEKSLGLLEMFTQIINDIFEKSRQIISLAYDMEKNNQGVRECVEQLVANQAKNDDAVKSIFDVIASLIAKTKKIGDITKLINRISSETNLLGLNAKVEAVRAGAVGKGFAVVAEEIQRLSRESSDASGSINDTIQVVMEEIGLLEKVAQRSQAIFSAQRETVLEVSSAFEKNSEFISTYIDEQKNFSLAIEEMKEEEHVLSGSISSIFSSVREVSATANEISSLTYNQNNLISLLCKLGEDLAQNTGAIEKESGMIQVEKRPVLKKKIAVLFDTDNSFWDPTIKETAKTAEAYHFDVEFFRPKKGGVERVEEMAGMLDDIIERRFNGIVIGPVDHDIIAQKLREMNRLGIKIVFINSKLGNVDYVSLIQTEGKAAGATAAKAVMGAMGTQGEVIVNTWADMYISAIEDRKTGFIQEIQKSSSIVVHEAPVKGKPVGAEKETFDDILQKYPNARFIFLTNCEWGVAFAEYAKKYRPKIQVVVIDFTKDIQKAMNEGYIQYAIGQRAYSWGSMALHFLDNSFQNKSVKKYVDTGTFEVNQQNINIYNSIV